MNIDKIGKKIIAPLENITTKATSTNPLLKVDPNVVMKHLDATAATNRVAVNKVLQLTPPQKQLQERLNRLDTQTALHRWDGDNARFGQEGILSILENATSEKNIAIINAKLDELEQGGNIWVADIVQALSSQKNNKLLDQ